MPHKKIPNLLIQKLPLKEGGITLSLKKNGNMNIGLVVGVHSVNA